MSSIRILIAEDHAMLADALGMLLDTQADMACIGVAADGVSALAQAQQRRPDVLLLDLGLPGLDGLAVMTALQAMEDPPRCLVVTARMDAGSVRAALALGALGYLPKNESSSELLLAIRRVAQGRSYRGPNGLRQIRFSGQSSSQSRLPGGHLVDPGSLQVTQTVVIELDEVR